MYTPDYQLALELEPPPVPELLHALLPVGQVSQPPRHSLAHLPRPRCLLGLIVFLIVSTPAFV
jgi:hypothetical protein